MSTAGFMVEVIDRKTRELVFTGHSSTYREHNADNLQAVVSLDSLESVDPLAELHIGGYILRRAGMEAQRKERDAIFARGAIEDYEASRNSMWGSRAYGYGTLR